MAVSSNHVEVRQVTDGAVLAVFTNRPTALWPSFSRDGSRLAVYGTERSLVWDLSTGRTLFEYPGQLAMALSPDGKQLLRASHVRGAVLLDLGTQQELARFEQALQPSFAAFSLQGDRVALWRTASIEVWNLTTQRREGELRLPGDIQGLAWHPDGTALALGCVDHLIYVWSWADGRTLTLRGHQREGMALTFHPSGDLLASGAFDNTLFLWDPHMGVPLLTAHGVGPLGFTADGQWLVAHGPRGLGRLRVHRAAECRLLHAGIAESQHRWVLDFSPDSRWLVGLNAGDGVVWDLATGQVVWRQALPGVRSSVFLDPDTLLTASRDGLQQWTNTGPAGEWSPSVPVTLIRRPGRMDYISLARDRRRLLMWLDGAGALFDMPQALDEPSSRRRQSAPTFEPRIMRGLTSAATNADLLPLTEPCLWLRGQPLFGRPVCSPDGRWIASGYWNNLGDYGSALWLWSAQDGQPMRQIPFGCCSPEFSPDGRWLLVAGGPEYRLYAVNGLPSEWREVWREPRLANSSVPGLACFAMHRDWLALQADDRIIRVLDVDSRRELARLTPLALQLWGLAWSADGRWLATGSADYGTHLWDLQLLRARLRELGLDWE